MTSDHISAQSLVLLAAAAGVKHVIISPGSRNAPLILAFNRHPDFNCISVPDERSAGFIAVGMAQSSGTPAMVICTSGSAVSNYLPAVTEAWYRKLPLIVVSADRPRERIDIYDGQTIRQQNIFGKHIRSSVNLLPENSGPESGLFNDRLINQALNASMWPLPGPVHINVPFSEPLYGMSGQFSQNPRRFVISKTVNVLSDTQLAALIQTWNNAPRRMVLVGLQQRDDRLTELLKQLVALDGTLLLCECTSNVNIPSSISCIDRLISGLNQEQMEAFSPDLLISVGGPLVSKRIKGLLRNQRPAVHWHIEYGEAAMDTFFSLTDSVPMQPADFLEAVLPGLKHGDESYSNRFKTLNAQRGDSHLKILKSIPYSDLKIFDHLLGCIPSGWDLHLANSTPVRYAQLFEPVNHLRYFANRGTSGIDGSISTAIGGCIVSGNPTLIVTGDMSFFYDSNALWNDNIPENFRILLINNGGGGIFRYIPGPDQTPELETFFEAGHAHSAQGICRSFGFSYKSVETETELINSLGEFFVLDGRAQLLEVHSPRYENAAVLRSYFEELKGV